MIKIGLTGGIGSGKTTVAKIFSSFGVPVYFADEEAKKLMNSSKKIKKKLIAEFGIETYKDGQLNRPYLSSIVFNDKKKLAKINAIVHPEVAKHFAKWAKKQEADYIIQENAILFENNNSAEFDFIIVVTAPDDIKIARILKRDASTKEEILSRMSNQWNDDKKVKLSDFVIHNNNLDATKKQVRNLHKKLLGIKKNIS